MQKNKSGAVWQIIHKGMGKPHQINWNSVEIKHSKNMTELCNSYFSRISQNLLKKHGDRRSNTQNHQFKIKDNTKTMFLLPVTENEVGKLVKDLRKNHWQEMIKYLIVL